MNITLIGMPGSGKSFIGRKLAERLNYTLIELDALMERDYNSPLQAVLDQLGEETFLKKQEEDAIRHTGGRDSLVISPGGSIIYTEQAMRHLKNIGTVVYLEAPLGLIAARIGAAPPRGIVGSKAKTLEGLYNERTPLYEKWAHETIDADRDVEVVIAHLLELVERHEQ